MRNINLGYSFNIHQMFEFLFVTKHHTYKGIFSRIFKKYEVIKLKSVVSSREHKQLGDTTPFNFLVFFEDKTMSLYV